jgi:acetyltransferase-like isoleucine patch superfamily enzyme
MIIAHSALERLRELLIILFSRGRAIFLRFRGSAVGGKVSIGRGCKIDRPWCVSLAPRVKLEEHVYLKVVDNDARLVIGSHTFIGRGVEIDCQESIELGNHVLLAPGCFITDHNHGLCSEMRLDQQPCVSAPVIIEDDVWVGANAVVLPGVHLGKGSVVGAGAVVTGDVDADAVVGGVPARVISYRSVCKEPLSLDSSLHG